MCVIVCSENPDVWLDRNDFKKCWETNDHGAGFAWLDEGKVHFIKGFMTEKKAWNAYKHEVIGHPHIAHFRLTSAGTTCKELTHPFIVSPDSPIYLRWSGDEDVLFHNGTVSAWENTLLFMALLDRKYPEGKMSDSRVFAMVCGRLGEYRTLSESWSRWAVLSRDHGIQTYGSFINRDGMSFSNLSWTSEKIGYGRYSAVSAANELSFDFTKHGKYGGTRYEF
jgi:predicted glutamine amidotransferase